MPKPALIEVRAHLQAYLLGVESLSDFHRWFVGWRRANPENANPLTRNIGLRIAEFTRGHWSEPQLRCKLLELLQGTPTIAPQARVETSPWQVPDSSFAARFEASPRQDTPATHSE
jgi:hypothetical protein